jgi:hypothetical protein
MTDNSFSFDVFLQVYSIEGPLPPEPAKAAPATPAKAEWPLPRLKPARRDRTLPPTDFHSTTRSRDFRKKVGPP